MTVRPATQAQIDYINRLKDERDLSLTWEPGMSEISDEASSTAARAALEASREVWRQMHFLPATTASTLIDYLKAAPRKGTAAPVATEDQESLEGMHFVNGTVYKVQRAVHGSGHLYAKVLTVHEEGSASFEYAAGAIRRLSADTKMSLEQAKEFGALYGVCCQCGRTLTDETSIEAGIGPVCAGRF